MTKRITKEEGIKLLKQYNTPEHVIGHCVAVTDTALNIAKAINKAGKNLDLDMITGAAIIHDIARVESHHEIVGAEYADSIGLHDEANIIKQHMRYPGFNDIENVNEADIVCLSDRIVLEDSYAGLDARIDYIINKAVSHGASEENVAEILEKKQETAAFIKDIEKLCGRDFDEICKKKEEK